MIRGQIISIHGRARTAEREEEIDLGLSVLECLARPGVPMPLSAIAAATGMSHAGPHMIVEKALRKIRARLQFGSEQQTYRELSA